LGPEPWRCAYVQPSRRPADGRYGENPFRLGKHLQLQVVLKPSPDDVQGMFLRSLERLGIAAADHDIRFEEDNWESPTLGAWGVGWQVVMDGMEITQVTYFQQAGGIYLSPISAEITYGSSGSRCSQPRSTHLRRDVERDAVTARWRRRGRAVALRVRGRRRRFHPSRAQRGGVPPCARRRVRPGFAYEAALACSHAFNILDARGAVCATDRVGLIRRVRDLACACARAYLAERQAAASEASQPEPAAV
jgi:glycyl-tRNA synthetase alpha chain